MTTSGCTSFLDESEKKRSEAKRIRDQSMLALVPCLRCSRASKKCWVGVNSKKCAYCTENIVLCTVNLDKYDNAKTIVAGTQSPLRASPGQGSEEAFKEEAERLYALNPLWHIQEAETRLSSLQPSAAKLSHRKRTGKHIRDERKLALTPCLRRSRAGGYCRVDIKAKDCAYCTEQRINRKKRGNNHTVVDKNHFNEPIKPKFRPRRKGISKPVVVLQETCPITRKKVNQAPRRAEIKKELELASGSEYQSDSGSEFPPRVTAERESVESSEGGQEDEEEEEEEEDEVEEEEDEEEKEEEEEEEASPGSFEDIVALRREIIELRREMKEMQKEYRKGVEKILHARRHQLRTREIEIINLEDG